MKFKNFTKLLALAVVTTTSAMFTGCSSDDEPLMGAQTEQLSTRSRAANVDQVVNFDDFDSYFLAGPTSQGMNLYPNSASYFLNEWLDETTGYYSKLNTVNGNNSFSAGGIAVSNWNIRSNGTHTGDWWYSWNNQCSVYNVASTDGSNVGAAHSGDNFAVAYGYEDNFSQAWIAMPEFSFLDTETFESINRNIKSVYVCNTAYTYGVIINGNSWSSTPGSSATSLKDSKGWFKVLAYGYDATGNKTNNGNPVEFYLANYDSTQNGGKLVEPINTWTKWDLSALGSVSTIKFNFEGSDVGPYGLNTPAYVCLDDIEFN